jgi:hypothetical protein
MDNLPVHTPFALLGGSIGTAAVITTALLINQASATALGISLGVVGGMILLTYIVANVTAGSKFGEVLRGLLIGINAGLNFAILFALLTIILGPSGTAAFNPIALGIAIGLSTINFSTTLGFLTQSDIYQGFIGYLNWFLPMSWLVVGLGFIFMCLNALGALCLGLPGVAFFKISKFTVDWKTGTIFMKGGWISNANPINTAYNMGNFSFVDSSYSGMAIEHEAGHTLNLAAFGSIFHLIGAIDENIIRRGEYALSELLAESNVPSTPGPSLKMWA